MKYYDNFKCGTYMSVKKYNKNHTVRINTIIKGEPANWLKNWKERGIITNYTDAVLQALRTFHEKITENELKSVQLQRLKEIE